MVARGIDKVPSVGGVNVEEDTRDNDRLFFEELFEERLVKMKSQNESCIQNIRSETHQTIVQRRGERFEVEPNVERAVGRVGNFQAHLKQPLENVVTLSLKVLLESNLKCHERSTNEQLYSRLSSLCPSGRAQDQAWEWRPIEGGDWHLRQGMNLSGILEPEYNKKISNFFT